MNLNLPRPLHLILPALGALTALPLPAQATAVEQGRAALARGEGDAAITLLERAVARSPKDAEAHYQLGNAYGGKAERSGMLAAVRYAPKARGEWERAVALDPDHVHARFSLVEFYAMAPGIMGGSYDKAFEQAKALKGLDPVLAHHACALIYTQQKQPGRARQEYADALREQPGSAKAHSFFGQHLANAEQNPAAAFAEFEAALRLDPSYMPACYHLGRAAARAGANLTRGEELLKRYVAYTPTENEPPLVHAHYYLGLILEKEGKAAEAKRNYQAALRLDPTFKQASEALKRAS